MWIDGNVRRKGKERVLEGKEENNKIQAKKTNKGRI
jgi:hypothetical protein